MRLDHGRTGQKARTRQELLTAARRVMERGDPVAVVALSTASVKESDAALKGACRVDDAMADRIGASVVGAILDTFLPRGDRHPGPTGVGGSCKRLE